MPAETAVPFWGCLICANAWAVDGSLVGSLAWFVGAMAVLAVGVYKANKR